MLGNGTLWEAFYQRWLGTQLNRSYLLFDSREPTHETKLNGHHLLQASVGPQNRERWDPTMRGSSVESDRDRPRAKKVGRGLRW